MTSLQTIKINFRGGIVSPGELYSILAAAEKSKITSASIGLRQQLLLKVNIEEYLNFSRQLQLLNVSFETGSEQFPNVVSSYPAEEIFITQTWLSEGVYKDIFDLMDYKPQLKVNISDSNQSFTPLLTGNINWVASLHSPHFWHLFIRFPKTNIIYEWKQLVYTNDVAKVSKDVEEIIIHNPERFYDNSNASGDELFEQLKTGNYITQPARQAPVLPAFTLPYYEGLNRYNDKYWIGIYKRDEQFSLDFLKDICRLCLETKIGQLCSTPWKSLIIKSISEKDKPYWNALLAKHKVNMRHAANELNFQVEDDCAEGLQLKKYLVKHLNKTDTRTFGICIGIKTRRKSEVFSSILVRRKPLFSIAGRGFFYLYDILCAHEFNPNERTGSVFSRNNPKFFLAEQLRRAIFSFYAHYHESQEKVTAMTRNETHVPAKKVNGYVQQCSHCFSVYDEKYGDMESGILPGTKFKDLPETYSCALCEAPKNEFKPIDQQLLGLQTV
ncbi:MAG: rubredoxin [Bacteroidota bacterium]|nr:rubredoxin [Bacteroidota bacterium]